MEQLVIDGARGAKLTFFSARDVDVMADGRLVVADFAARQVVVLSPTGDFIAALGGPGEGPGEFADRQPRRVAATGSHIVAGSIGARRVSVFSADEYTWREEIALPAGTFLDDLVRVGSDSIVLQLSGGGTRAMNQVLLVDLRTREQTIVARARSRPLGQYRRTLPVGGRDLQVPIPSPEGRLRIAGGEQYFAVADPVEYIVATFDERGRFVWGRESPDQRREITTIERRELSDIVERLDPSRGGRWAATIEFLETHHAAIAGMRIDGQNRLHVYRTPGPDSDGRTIDIYGANGTLVSTAAADRAAFRYWRSGRGSRVYGIRSDSDGNALLWAGVLELGNGG